MIRIRRAPLLLVALLAGGCSQAAAPPASATPPPTSSATSPPTTSVSTTLPPSTTSATVTTVVPSTSTLPLDSTCDERAGPDGEAPPGEYQDARLDRFGPLEASPSLTLAFEPGVAGAELGLHATRIDRGVLVSESRSPDRPSSSSDQIRFVVVNHDGTVRWNRCVPGNRDVQTAVAAPRFQPRYALMRVLAANVPQLDYRFIQLSLATGREQPTFESAMEAAGVDPRSIARLTIADTDDRYALLVDDIDVFGGDHRTAVRYDLVNDVAVDLRVPDELVAPATGACTAGRRLALADGDVVVIETTIDMVSGATELPGTGAVSARWHDGEWSNDAAALAATAGVRPGFACEPDASARVLQGVDGMGAVQWTDQDLTHPGADDIGWYRDGDVAVGQVCSRRSGDECRGLELVGVDTANGHVLWTQPGLRLVAATPADGYALAWDEPVGDVLEPPGWVVLNDRTGDEVPDQRWGPESFTLHPSREVAGFNTTTRTGGVVLVVAGDEVHVWYPQGTGGAPRRLSLP